MNELLLERERRLNRLFAQAQSGDGPAYREVLTEVRQMLENYYRRALGPDSPQIADLTQETLLAIHEKRATYDPRQLFGPWLFAIARYKLIDFYRRGQRERLAYSDEAWERLERTLVAPDAAQEFATHVDLETLLSELPERPGRILRLLKVQGWSLKETAAETGMTEGALKVAVHRALRTLRQKLRKAAP